MGTVGPRWLVGGHETSEVTPIDDTSRVLQTEKTKTDLWHEWVDAVVLEDVRDTNEPDPVPLFETDDNLTVQLNRRGGLKRSETIDAMIRREGKRCVHETGVRGDTPDSLLYIMYQLAAGAGGAPEPTDVVPRYIGKAEAYGKKNELSANFTEIAKDRDATRSFAHWGDGDYWHTGELSNTVFGTDSKKTAWATELFEQETHRLKRQTYLWIRAWDSTSHRGPYGYESSLAEAEPLLIGLAYDASPEQLLNHSGVSSDAPVKTREHHFEPVRVSVGSVDREHPRSVLPLLVSLVVACLPDDVCVSRGAPQPSRSSLAGCRYASPRAPPRGGGFRGTSASLRSRLTPFASWRSHCSRHASLAPSRCASG
jgi:hypothetical protein